MVAIVTGQGLGLERTSTNQLGNRGTLGSAFLGRANDGVTVNAATGNLLIQNSDEVLIGRGPDAFVNRTYNSQGIYSNLGGAADIDNWWVDSQRKVVLTGTANAAGSSVVLTDWDGSIVTFNFVSGVGYKSTEFPYQDDTLSYTASPNTWIWTEGKSRRVETFESTQTSGTATSDTTTWRLKSSADSDSNAVSYTYETTTTGKRVVTDRLTKVSTANAATGQNSFVRYIYDVTAGKTNNLISIQTNYYDLATSTNKTLTRVRYTYDNLNRLETVRVDKTPGDEIDNDAYVTTYSYAGTDGAAAKRIASISQSDGTFLIVSYDGLGKVKLLEQTTSAGITRRTAFDYGTDINPENRVVTITQNVSNSGTVNVDAAMTLVSKMYYDTSNRLVRLDEPPHIAGADPQVTTYEYTSGQITKILKFDNSANVGNAGLAIESLAMTYDTNGNLLQTVDGTNRTTSYAYGLKNELLSSTVYTGLDPDGILGVLPSGAQATNYAYDIENHLRFMISPEGRVTEYRYDLYGNQTAQIIYTNNSYSGTNSESTLSDWVSTTADKTQTQRTDTIYDFRLNVTSITSYSKADANGLGNTLEDWTRIDFTYDQFGKLLTKRTSGANALAGYAEPALVTETFLYDGMGRVISSSDIYGVSTAISYTETATSRTIVVTTPNDTTKTSTYNIAGELIRFAESGVGIATQTTLYDYDAFGRLRIKTDPVGVKTYFLYDREGRLAGEIDGDGSLTEFKYDANDRVIATVRYATSLSTSNLGSPATNVELSSIRPTASGADRWSWSIYDKAGRLAQTIDAAGATQQFTYDGAGRLLISARYATVFSSAAVEGFKTTLPQASMLPPGYDDTYDRREFNYYDNDGLQIGVLDEDGYLTEFVYDKAGRKVETIRYSMQAGHNLAEASRPSHWRNSNFATLKATADDGPAGDIHNYWLYEGRGRIGAEIDGEGNVTRYHYNVRGQVDQEVRGQQVVANTLYSLVSLPAASGILATTNFTYNAAGQVLTQVKLLSAGHTETTTFSYDTRGRLLKQTVAETVSTETRTQSFRYDSKGRLIGSMGGTGSVTMEAVYGTNPTEAQKDFIFRTYGTRFVYDAADRLIQKLTPDGSGNSGDSRRTLYYYDTDGQLRYEINALGEVMEYRYNALEDRTDSFVYGSRIDATTLASLSGGLVNDVAASAVSGIANATLDSREQWSYDTRGQLVYSFNALYQSSPTQSNYSITNHNSNVFGEVSTTYDPTDTPAYHWDLVARAYNRRGTQTSTYRYLNGSASGSTQSYNNYDAFSRIINAYDNNIDSRGSSYSYDRANRLSKEWEEPGAAGNYRQTWYDSLSNKTSFRDRTGNITSFGYDAMDTNGIAIAASNRTGHYRTITTTTAEGVISRQTANAYGQTISVTDGAGRTTSYTYDKNDNLRTATDAAGETINIYDNADRLIETKDARGVKTTYTYDAVGRVLTEVRDDGGIGATTAYEYDAKGQQTRVTDAREVVTDLTYDLKGQKLTVTQDVGGLAITTKYDYRADGKVSRMTEAQGKPEQRITDYKYDTMGRLLEEIVDPSGLNLSTKYSYDVNNNVVSITDARNNVTRLVYDKENRQILSVSPQGEVVETGYDAEGRAIWNRSYVNRIAQVTVDNFALEVAENAVRSSFLADDSKDRITRTIYDGDGRRSYTIDGEGYTTRFRYDGANNIDKTVVYETAYTNATSTTSKVSLDAIFGNIDTPPTTASVTTFTYDNANRLTSTTDAELFTESYEYDAVGNRTQVTNRLNGITHFTYDNLNRVRTEYVNALIYNDAGTQTASGYYKNQYEYDALGNVMRQVEGNIGLLATYGAAHAATARETKFEYDKLGRLNKKTQDTFQSTITPIETFAYDARGNLVLYTDPSLAKTYTYYDADNRKIASVSQVNTTGGGQATYQSWGYDGTGNVVSEKTWGTLVGVPSEVTLTPPLIPGGEYRETTFDYDRNGGLRKRNVTNIRIGSWNSTSYVSNAGQTLTVETIFDAFGNLIQEIDANNNVTSHWYDRNGRETAKVDANSFLTKWTRDEDGNVTWERRYATALAGAPSVNGVAPSVADHADDRITTFAYDKNGRRLSETRVGMLVSTFSSNNETPLSQDALIGYAYNGLGEVTSKTEANGDVTTYTYDNQGRLSWQRNTAITDFDGISVHRRTVMFYDALGNLVRSSEQAVNASGNYATGYSNTDDRITRYGYDKGRLTWTTDATNFTRHSKYDVNSRIVEESYTRYKADGVTAVQEAMLTSYDLGGRLTQTRTAQWNGSAWVDQPPSTTLTYNAYGEVSTKSLGGVLQEQFQYDLAGRVAKSTAGDGIWKLFGYDANGNATITITSAGDSLAGYANIGAALAPATAQEGINATYIVYDQRNMATQTVEEGRRLTATGALTNLTSSRAYNAFGEVIAETDARNNTTNYSYNAMGLVTKVEAPTVSDTSESGVVSNIRPTQLYYYDISGRQIGSRDANLYLTTRSLLAGTGHDGGEALILSEYRPDSSVWSNGYDAFGNVRKLTGGLNRITTQAFDKAGRVTQITRPATTAGTLIDSFAYDGLGRKVKAWSAALISPATILQETTTDYDALGRVIATKNYAGDLTTISYVWNGSIATTGLGTFGGWVKTISTIADRYSTSDAIIAATETTDNFGRMLARSDNGLYRYEMTFNNAGQLVSEVKKYQYSSSVAHTTTNTYYNTGQLATSVAGAPQTYGSEWTQLTTTANYDAVGMRVYERLDRINKYWVPPTRGIPGEPGDPGYWETETAVIQDGRAVYDALGRMTSYTDIDPNGIANVTQVWEYDAASNIRRMRADYKAILANGSLAATDTAQEYWYKYDALSRMVTTKGLFSGVRGSGTITRGTVGTDISYNGAGERATATTGQSTTAKLETYNYNAAGQLSNVTIRIGTGVTRTRAEYTRDLLGRVTEYLERDNLGAVTHQRYGVVYNARDQVLADKTKTKRGSDWIYTHGTNYYTEAGQSITRSTVLGSTRQGTSTGAVFSYSETKNWKSSSGSMVLSYPTVAWDNSSGASTADTSEPDAYVTNSYVWTDGAVQNNVVYVNRDGQTSAAYQYDAGGALRFVDQTGGALARAITFANDTGGKVLERSDNRGPKQRYFRFGGIDMGSIGNDGTDNVDYDAAITARNISSGTGAYRGGATIGTPYADFDQSFDSVNPANEAPAGSYYTVRTGDTLQSVAQAMWGDGSLWYLLAEANGLSAGSALTAGQGLVVPEKGSNFRNTADTFRPYDASKAIGDTQPGAPKPPNAKCGVLGQLILVAIAVAVTALTAGTGGPLAGSAIVSALGVSSTAGAVIGGAAAAALGSVVSQGFGVATGLQDKFSFKQVALAGISGAIGGGLGEIAKVGKLGTAIQNIGKGLGKAANLVGDVARGAISSALSQGVSVATGLQKSFSWTGVAVAGIGAGVAGAATRGLGSIGVTGFGNDVGSTMADTIAQAATRSAIKGDSFGDNLLASLPSALGNLAGRALAAGVGTAFDGKGGANEDSATDVVQTEGNARADEIIVSSSAYRQQQASREPGSIYLPGHPLYDPYLDRVGWSYGMELATTKERIYESERRERLEQRAKAAEQASWDKVELEGIVVEAIPKARIAKGMTIGFGDYPAQKTGPGGTWHNTFSDMAQSYNGTMSAWKTYLDPQRNHSVEGLAQQIWDEDGYWATESFTLGYLDSMAEHQTDFLDVASILRGKLADLHSRSSAEVNKLLFVGIGAPAAIASGGAGIVYLAGGALTAGGITTTAVSLDFAQSSVRGYANGSFEAQSTAGGTAITYGSRVSRLNIALGYDVDGERTYALGTAVAGGVSLLRSRPWQMTGYGPSRLETNPNYLGRIDVPDNLTYGGTLFGDHVHVRTGNLLQQKYPGVEFIDRTAPGMRGVDFSTPKLRIEQVGMEHFELKPASTSGVTAYNRQVQNWGYNPATVQLITYDKYGHIWIGLPPK